MNSSKFFRNEGEIEFQDQNSFDKKMSKFIEAYKSSRQDNKKVIVVTDFDYTITSRYNYKTGYNYESSYGFYDEDVIGGNQKKIDEIESNLYKEYGKYEFDTSFDFNLRLKETLVYYEKSLEVYINKNFTKDALSEMIAKKRKVFEFRKYAKEYFEILIELGIPVIIVSGGVTQLIEESLKLIIPNLEQYINEKKIIIESNNLIFDPISKGCIGFNRNEIIHCFNKATYLKKIVFKYFPNVTNLFILGDHLGDYDSITELNLNKENIVGFGFLNLNPEDIQNKRDNNEKIQKDIQEYKNKFDMVMIGEHDYHPFIKFFKSLK